MLLRSVVRANQQTFTSIRSYFAWDHRRLEESLAEIARLVEAGKLERATRAFAHYERGMRRHMRVEEEVLLELYAHERTGAARSPSSRMQPEHAEIGKLIEKIGHDLAAGDAAAFTAGHTELVALVSRHDRQEETDLYPYFDALVGPAEAERIVSRLRSE
jgi:hemerythrin-like domain-containing protein